MDQARLQATVETTDKNGDTMLSTLPSGVKK